MAAAIPIPIPIWKYLNGFDKEELFKHCKLKCTTEPKKSSARRNFFPEYLKADNITWARMMIQSPPLLGEGMKIIDIGVSFGNNPISSSNYLANLSANFNESEIAQLGGDIVVEEAKEFLAFLVRLKDVIAELLYGEMHSTPSDTLAALKQRCGGDEIKMKERFLEEFRWWPEMVDKESGGRIYAADAFAGEKLHKAKCEVFHQKEYTAMPPLGIPNNDPTSPFTLQQIEENIVKMESLGYRYQKIQFVDANGPVQLYDVKVVSVDEHGMPVKTSRIPKSEPHPARHGAMRQITSSPRFNALKYRPVVSLILVPKVYDQAQSKDLSYGISMRFQPEIGIILQGSDHMSEEMNVGSVSSYAVAGRYDGGTQMQASEEEIKDENGGGGKLANGGDETIFPHALETDDDISGEK